MTAKEVKKIIRQLKIGEMRITDVPEEVRYHKEIIKAERNLKLRKECNRGYDVIHDFFFVEEQLFWADDRSKDNREIFNSFEEYYDYLDGDIYQNACYQYCNFEKYSDYISEKGIDISRLLERKSFLTRTLDDVTIGISQKEIDIYKKAEKRKALIKKWIKKFDACTSKEELEEVVSRYNKGSLKQELDVSFFFYNYILKDVDNRDRFHIIMEYMSTEAYPGYKIKYELPVIYDSNDVINNFVYSRGAKSTYYSHRRKLKDYVQRLEAGQFPIEKRYYFDRQTHFYTELTQGINKNICWSVFSYPRIFETFDEFIEYRKGNLRGVDLSGDIELNVDLSQYKTDETTKIPPLIAGNIVSEVDKEYADGKFTVHKIWRSEKGCLVKEDIFTSPYFFDFVYYLKGDLSGANLLLCDGLENLTEFDKLDFSGTKLPSKLCEKFGVAYENYELNADAIYSFAAAEKNEQEFLAISADSDKEMTEHNRDTYNIDSSWKYNMYNRWIYYVSDIHLMHRLENAKCRSKEDVIKELIKIVDIVVKESGEILLIGGDTSSDFSIFVMFIQILKWRLASRKKIIFILGNHEFWSFPGKSIDEIIEIYRKVIEENGMFLLHNELLYTDAENRFYRLSYEELVSMSVTELRKQIASTRLVIFGGCAFSGYNMEFNANQGIYRKTLNREGEIIETKKYEELYNKVLPAILDKNTIIFTHTPKKDWATDAEPSKNLVYVSGHTHRNEFYDDGEYRIYSDNQIGYRNDNIHIKSLVMDSEYDSFSDYKDGIYEVTSAQYVDFYRGKNIQMDFNREVNALYMLKKKGYYCFIHQSSYGYLSILNGGSLRRLERASIEYYYEHMDEMISYIRKPLDKYMNMQKKISDAIRKIGGDGKIHGCIVDIDWYNHIYVNPEDAKIVGYWAEDMVNKLVYPDIPTLLKKQCPMLYENYQKLIKGEKDNPLVPGKKKKDQIEIRPQKYLSTDIYKASREMKRMQRLSSNILTTWYEISDDTNLISGQ